MNNLSSQTLAQIVTANQDAASVFEKHKLDFCCKGKRTLEQACADQKIQISEILDELETATRPQGYSYSFQNLTATQLIDHIISVHHNYVKKTLPQLVAYSKKVALKHGDQHPELEKIYGKVEAINSEMLSHMQKEEVVLFPRIKEFERMVGNTSEEVKINKFQLLGPITVMQQEHDHAGLLLSEIRSLSNDFTAPQNACTTYKLLFSLLESFERDLHQHVHLENNILFPKAIAMVQGANQVSSNEIGGNQCQLPN